MCFERYNFEKKNHKLFKIIQAYNRVVAILSKTSVLMTLVIVTCILLTGHILMHFNFFVISNKINGISQFPNINQLTTSRPANENLEFTPSMPSGMWRNVSLSNVNYEFTIISDIPRTKEEAYHICKSINAR